LNINFYKILIKKNLIGSSQIQRKKTKILNNFSKKTISTIYFTLYNQIKKYQSFGDKLTKNRVFACDLFKLFVSSYRATYPENKKRRGKCNKTQLQFYEC
jgi:hypothetical protein